MALTSPGVEVTIIDQSQYLPAPTNSVPLVILATAQNKADASGTGVAAATTAANAGKLFQVTSQRDLVNLYGKPFFYTTTNGTPIQGYELNEYGLLAAYSLLGVTNRCYVLRADIDLASLVGQTGRPTGAPANGTYWLDTTSSTWGIYEFNSTTGKFTVQTPIVITDPANLSAGVPLASIGNIGDYAVNAIDQSSFPSSTSSKNYFFKGATNEWVSLGGNEWKSNWPTIQGTDSPTSLTAGNNFVIRMNGLTTVSATIQVPISPNDTVDGVAAAINNLGWGGVSAANVDGKLQVYSTQYGQSGYISIAAGSVPGTVLSDLGITVGNYFQPSLSWGTAAEMPLWTSSQSAPRPTGSVWVKVGSAGNGLAPVMSSFNATTQAWTAKTVTSNTSDWATSSTLDATGGQAIAAGTVYCQYFYDAGLPTAPVYFWERLVTGSTTASGTVTTPTFGSSVLAPAMLANTYYEITSVGSSDFTSVGASSNTIGVKFFATGSTTGSGTVNKAYALSVQTSIPGSSSLSSVYTVDMSSVTNGNTFVIAWTAANIPYTSIGITTDGAIAITHTEGGEIVMNDSTLGKTTSFLAAAGFDVSTTSCKYGPSAVSSFEGVVTGGSGSGAVLFVASTYQVYTPSTTTFSNAGVNYSVGDVLTVAGNLLGGTTTANDLVVEVTQVNSGTGAIEGITYVSGTAAALYTLQISNWVDFSYTANEGAPVLAPTNNTNWFYSVVDQVDIMVNHNGQWNGYKNVNYDSSGFPTNSGANATDPNGPLVSASEPTTQSDGTTSLVYGDLWIDTSDLENYPVISRWEAVTNGGSTVDQWVLIDNSNQTGSNGVVFADARWGSNGTINPANDPIPSITSLLTSDYLDLDAPESSLYPNGMILFNTRRSGYNVKQYRVNYFSSTAFPDQVLPTEKDAWVSVSGLQSNGSPYMGRKAQRALVVAALRSVIDTNTDIRDEDNFFNLMATPNYPELQPNMVVLNADRGETGYIIGDTPLRLADDATQIQAWATNAAGATSTGEDGLVTRNTYMGLFYPSGIAPDLSGNLVAVPASHMMLRTFLRNDTVSYPWLAAAGTRRGIIENATNIGYVDSTTGEFVTIKTRIGIRDVLYTNFIDPLVFFTGIGLLNYGNKTSYNSSSALDRTNVARLVAYLRRQLTLAARPFVFEPNDSITRQQIAGVVETLLVDLVSKRGIYDYLVVCDESNNTPARIDRNELWIDVAIEPVKSVEFIYIPVRILNTGELSA